MNTTIAVEKAAHLLGPEEFPRFEALLKEHWNEIVQHKDIMKLAPLYEKYLDLDKEGRLHIVAVREEGLLVGYSIHFLARNKNMHYGEMFCAEGDIDYLVPELRKTGMFEIMRRFALADMKKLGVQYVSARTKIEQGHDNTLRRIGYKPVDQVYGLNLVKWEDV